ncbi:MAG: AAA family ATPase, partial [Actinomycetota bacterium]|nr:AAA family ATPase [Actinomycetota bacterium]
MSGPPQDGSTAGGSKDNALIPVVGAKRRAPPSFGLPRERLIRLLDYVWDGRMAVVTGPAGSGKTTLLAQYASSFDGPIAWYHAEPADGDPRQLLAHIHQGLSSTLGTIGSAAAGWGSVDDAVAALDGLPERRTLLVIDDIHALEGTPSAAAVERLACFAPPSLGIMVASRRQPDFDLSRIRVADRLVEIDADALRFRSWEVERLFHDIYREPLPPVDLAALARRTQGWAAGLQLFHLASRGKPVSERRQMVHNLSSRSRLVREYLTHNVIDELPADLRQFLIETCVLGRLTGATCDALLSRSGSASVLEEVERRQIFLSPIDDGSAYRYHEVFRSHLEACLVDQIGERRAKERYGQAGALLEASGASSEALRAYCRAGDESAALRLLSRSGAKVADDPGAWLDLLPSGLADHDPWLMLATARHHLAAGHWRQALASYERAESSFNGSGDQCRRERLTLTMWLEPMTPPTNDWVGAILQATRKDPLAAGHLAAALPGPNGHLATGLAAMLAGQLHDARRLLRETADDAEASPAISAGAWLAAGIAGLLVGAERAQKDVHQGREQAEDLGLTWLARLANCAELHLGVKPPPDATAILPDAEDAWGGALYRLLQGLGWRSQPEAACAALCESADLFRRLGAGV